MINHIPMSVMHAGVPDQEPANRTVLGYARLADLEFALIVWRQNLKRDLASTPSKEVHRTSWCSSYGCWTSCWVYPCIGHLSVQPVSDGTWCPRPVAAQNVPHLF